jgi:glutaredoxin
MKNISLLLAVTLLLVAAFFSSASAEIYRWVDEAGTTHFSDAPPPDQNTDARVYEPAKANLESRPMPEKRPIPEFMKSNAKEEKQKRSSSGRDSVELYTTTWCPGCKTAKKWLRRNKVRYTEYDVERDPEANRRYRKLGSGGKIPFAVINGVKIVGFSEARYIKALEMN